MNNQFGILYEGGEGEENKNIDNRIISCSQTFCGDLGTTCEQCRGSVAEAFNTEEKKALRKGTGITELE